MSWDPWDEEEQEEPTEEVTLEHPKFPGGRLVFILQRASESGSYSTEDWIEQMVRRYVTGDPDEGTKAELYAVGGKQLRLNRTLIRVLGYLLVQQRQDEKFDVDRLLGLMVKFSPQFRELRSRSMRLQNPGKAAEPLNPFQEEEDTGEEAGSSNGHSKPGSGIRASKSARMSSSAELPTP